MKHKKTKEQFEQEMYERHGGRITPLENYNGVKTEILFRCNVCGKEWRSFPSKLLYNGCSRCSGNEKRTQEQIKQQVFDKHNGNIEFIGNYINSVTKSLFRCNVCGNEWMTTPYVVTHGHGCPRCAGIEKKTQEQVTLEVLEKHGGKIELRGKYIDACTKTLFHCNVCGKDWEVIPINIIRGTGCPRCSKKERKTRSQIEQEVIEKHHGDIKLIGDFINTKKKTLFHCNVCGNEWMATSYSIVSGHGCPQCKRRILSEKRTKSRDQISKQISEKHKGKIEMVGENYVDTRTKMLFHCNECGNYWEAKPNNILNGRGCPRCASSHGEEVISSWLNSNLSREDWKPQAKFVDCIGIGGGQLSFDFYISSKNLCIEYQGIQHYQPTAFSGKMDAESQFLNQKEHDRRKRQYCIDNGITLLEIPYTDYDRIEEILEENLL